MKTCSKCKEHKPLEMFSKQRATKSGLRFACKMCDVARYAAYRAANREKLLAYAAARRADPRYRAAQAAYHATWRGANHDWVNWCKSQSRMLRGGR